jgi:hypothetical protein
MIHLGRTQEHIHPEILVQPTLTFPLSLPCSCVPLGAVAVAVAVAVRLAAVALEMKVLFSKVCHYNLFHPKRPEHSILRDESVCCGNPFR